MNLGDFYHVTNVGAGAPKVSFKVFWNNKIKSYIEFRTVLVFRN